MLRWMPSAVSRFNDALRHRQQTDPMCTVASIPTNVSYSAARAPLEELVLHNTCLGSGGCFIVAPCSRSQMLP